MKILVGYKRVVDYNVRIQVKPDGSGVVTDGVKLSANPFDEIALEEALRLRDKGVATEVVVATIAPADAQAHLRNGLAMGANRAIHVVADGAVSPLTAAKTLLKLVEKEQPDLVILGKQAIDDDANQTGQMHATFWGRPQAPFASKLDLADGKATVVREVAAGFRNPVMLYSVGKDSSVLLHLLLKAFYPARPPIPLLHVDTGWKFREMIKFRDRRAAQTGVELRTWMNPEGVAAGVGPVSHGATVHTDVMKTQALKQALDHWGFDAAIGGARRDEEKSRAKERIFSFRSAQHRWDPKNQRPELWNLYNTRIHKNESVRVFPISNWTELDVWLYIYREKIPVPSLYFAQERPVVERDGALILVDDERLPLQPGETPATRHVRFRTLGCYPLTGAIESKAATLTAIIQEMLLARTSERQGRVIDHDAAGSMEKKKWEGYF